MKIEPLKRDKVVKPFVQAFYLILNGNDQQLRKAASQLFGFNAFSLSADDFVTYHQLMWFMTAILPYEKYRILGRVGYLFFDSLVALRSSNGSRRSCFAVNSSLP